MAKDEELLRCQKHHDTTNPIASIPEAGTQLPGLQILMPHLYAQNIYECGETMAHAAFSPCFVSALWCWMRNTQTQNKQKMSVTLSLSLTFQCQAQGCLAHLA